jgi:hypothetical protein
MTLLPGSVSARLLLALAALVGLTLLGGLGDGFGAGFPESVGLPVAAWADALQAWVIRNRATSFVFSGLFRPLGALAASALSVTLALLETLGWPGVLVLVALGSAAVLLPLSRFDWYRRSVVQPVAIVLIGFAIFAGVEKYL